MFRKIVLIEPIGFAKESMDALGTLAGSVVSYADRPRGDQEVIERIGDADAALLTYTSSISGAALRACPNLRYVGMCNTLYSESNANVDMKTARELGIEVRDVKDYGDQGVAEYVVAELISFLHGYGTRRRSEIATELSGLKIGVVGMGTTGTLVANALVFFGANVSYFSRTRKPDVEAKGIAFKPLIELLEDSAIVCTCLTKGTVLLGPEEFRAFGDGKILVNTSIGPSFDLAAAKAWLDSGENEIFCDSPEALGDPRGILSGNDHVTARRTCSGITRQAYERLAATAIENIKKYLREN